MIIIKGALLGPFFCVLPSVPCNFKMCLKCVFRKQIVYDSEKVCFFWKKFVFEVLPNFTAFGSLNARNDGAAIKY